MRRRRLNIDMPSGPYVRIGLSSGVDLTLPPCNLACRESRVLCEVRSRDAIITTTLYRFAD